MPIPFANPVERLRHTWITVRDVLRFAARRADEERLAQVAGSLTFTTVLSMVPLLTIAFAVVTALPIFSALQNSLRDLLLQNLMPDSISTSIFKYLDQFASKARGLTLVGLVFLALTAVSTMLTVDRALNTIWRVHRPRPLSKRILVYWAVLTIGPVLMGLSLTLTSYLATATAGFVKQPPFIVTVLIDLVPMGLLTIAYAALYVYVPNRRVEWKDALVGGLAGALAFEVTKRGFAVYIARFPTYTVIYGALATVPLFLLWVYVSWLITLFGATVAASLPAIYGRSWNRGQAPGQAYADALRVLRVLYQARDQNQPGMNLPDVRLAARLGWEDAEPLLEKLEAEGLVVRYRAVSSTGTTRLNPTDLWMFVANPKVVTLDRVFKAFAFDGPSVADVGFSRNDPLATVVRDTRMANPDLTLDQVFTNRPVEPAA